METPKPQVEQMQGQPRKQDRFRQKEKIKAQKEKIRTFVAKVKEYGVFESVDERRRNIVEGYLANDEATFAGLRDQAGGVSTSRVTRLYSGSLETYWKMLPEEAKGDFREEEVLGSATGEPNPFVLTRQWEDRNRSMMNEGETVFDSRSPRPQG
jgi:hypothetical protein